MPNVDFERSLVTKRLPKTFDTPDLKRRLLQIKAKLDYEDQEIIRINFLDTFRPELWCLEGLARQLEPLSERHYDLALLEDLPKISVQFLNLPQGTSAWVLYVQVDSDHDIVDDGYFLKKVRDQIGFGSHQNIDVTITPGTENAISINAMNDESEGILPLSLATGTNTVLITARDQRIGAWLLFTFLCNYLDRGHKPLGFAASIAEKELFAKWSPFVVSNQKILAVFGFQPAIEHFRTALESQHYQMHYDESSQTWYISPPIFRFDIIHAIDILEDYLVATGYDFTEIQPRSLASPNAGSQTKRSMLEERLVDYMKVYGARQAVGLLLDSYENLVEHMEHDAPEKLIHLVNAANKNREYAVDSSLAPLLRNAVHSSAPMPPSTFFLFTETLFIDENNTAHSRWKMGILLVGTEHPFNNAHTLLDALCYHLRLDYSLRRSDIHALIPGRQMTAHVLDTSIGQFGEVHPEILTNWGLFYPTSFIELDMDFILELWGSNKAS
jgi:hypothetical protein